MDRQRYFERIGYDGPANATLETLRRLHRQHMLTVPFENLDIPRRPIVMDEAAFLRKLLDERRGGFCYELNGAFAALLRDLGFELTLLSAGVAHENGGFGPDFDHLALLVKVDNERWLADVGFGDSFLEPLRFDLEREQYDPAGLFRIVTDSGGTPLWSAVACDRFQTPVDAKKESLFILERYIDGAWRPQYRFSLTPHDLPEYAARCHYHQTSDGSSFTRQSICSLATADGRVTLSGRRLITTSRGKREERMLAGDAEWRDALRDYFQVTLPF